jgi:hypothetical protein
MNHNSSLIAILVAVTLGACSSDDINISPATTVTDSNNTTVTSEAPGANDACASYVNSGGQTTQGAADGNGNCSMSYLQI